MTDVYANRMAAIVCEWKALTFRVWPDSAQTHVTRATFPLGIETHAVDGCNPDCLYQIGSDAPSR